MRAIRPFSVRWPVTMTRNLPSPLQASESPLVLARNDTARGAAPPAAGTTHTFVIRLGSLSK